MNQESANSDLVLLFFKPFIYFLFCYLLLLLFLDRFCNITNILFIYCRYFLGLPSLLFSSTFPISSIFLRTLCTPYPDMSTFELRALWESTCCLKKYYFMLAKLCFIWRCSLCFCGKLLVTTFLKIQCKNVSLLSCLLYRHNTGFPWVRCLFCARMIHRSVFSGLRQKHSSENSQV